MRVLLTAIVLAFTGCSSGSGGVTWPELYPVKGTVTQGSKPVSGGYLQFRLQDGSPDYLVSGQVGADGTFTLLTSHAQEKNGTRKPGVPAGTYKVMYAPPSGDQTTGGSIEPIPLVKPITVNPGDNDIPITLPAGKK